MRKSRIRGPVTLAMVAVLALPAGSVLAATPGAPAMAGGGAAYTCTGGAIPSGSYASVTVTGACDVAVGAVITIAGNLNVEADAMLDLQSAPSTVTIGHNVTAAEGSFLGLGCQPPSYTHNSAHECVDATTGHSVITVAGNVTAEEADTVMLNGITVHGNVTLSGGGGEIPWSVKNDTIDGNLTVSEVTADWFGALFNHVAGNMTLTNITATDPEDPSPPVFVVRNTVGRNLICWGLGPSLSFGFVPGSANTFGRNGIGQCANPVVPNPAG